MYMNKKMNHFQSQPRLSVMLTFAILLFLAQLYQGEGWTIQLVNNCSYTIWPASLTTYLDFSLQQHDSQFIDVPPGTDARLWGRTSCDKNTTTKNFTCLTGDCGSGTIDCTGKLPLQTMPTTLVAFYLGGDSQYDYYYVSLQHGYNLPVMVAPQLAPTQCQASGCILDVDGACPKELRVGSACNSPCNVFKTNKEYCCVDNCGPTKYSRLFKKACPRAYTYTRDYGNLTLVKCKGSPYYTITFCPSPQVMTSAFLPSSNKSSPYSPTLSPSPIGAPTTVPTAKKKHKLQTYLIVFIPIAILIMLVFSIWVFMHKWKTMERHYEMNKMKIVESLQYDFNTIRDATHNFSIENKLGEGGFGEVYKVRAIKYSNMRKL